MAIVRLQQSGADAVFRSILRGKLELGPLARPFAHRMMMERFLDSSIVICRLRDSEVIARAFSEDFLRSFWASPLPRFDLRPAFPLVGAYCGSVPR